MTAFWVFLGAGVGAAIGLFAWLAWLDHRDGIWAEAMYDGDWVYVEAEQPDFFDWELEIMADGDT